MLDFNHASYKLLWYYFVMVGIVCAHTYHCTCTCAFSASQLNDFFDPFAQLLLVPFYLRPFTWHTILVGNLHLNFYLQLMR